VLPGRWAREHGGRSVSLVTAPRDAPRRRGPGRALRNFSALLSADLVGKLVAVGLVSFYARSLPGASLAFLPLYEMIGMLTVLASSFGMVPTLVRRLPALRQSDPQQARALSATAYRIPLVATTVLALGVALLADRLLPILPEAEHPSQLVRIMCLGFPALAARRTSDAILWAAGRFPSMARVDLTRTLGSVAALLLYLHAGLEGLLLGFALRDWTAAGVSRWIARDLLRGPRGAAYPPLRLIREARAYYAEAFVLYLRGQADRWVVASFLGPAALATYYVADRLTTFIQGAFQAADRVITTGVVGRSHDLAEVERHLNRLFLLFSQTVVPGICITAGLAPTLIVLLGGDAHRPAVVPAVLLLLATLTHFVQQPLARAVFAVRSPRERLVLSLVESVMLVGALALLTGPLGMIGAALARVVAGAAATAYAWRAVRRFARGAFPARALGVSTAAGLAATGLLYAAQQVQPALLAVPFEALGAVLVFLVVDALFNRSALEQAVREIRPEWRSRGTRNPA